MAYVKLKDVYDRKLKDFTNQQR